MSIVNKTALFVLFVILSVLDGTFFLHSRSLVLVAFADRIANW